MINGKTNANDDLHVYEGFRVDRQPSSSSLYAGSLSAMDRDIWKSREHQHLLHRAWRVEYCVE